MTKHRNIPLETGWLRREVIGQRGDVRLRNQGTNIVSLDHSNMQCLLLPRPFAEFI